MRILLATLHAKYVHSSLALPCLAAACAEVSGTETVIREFTVNEPRDQTLRRIVAEQPDVAAFSCYIWNIEQVLCLASDLKQVLPRTLVILGGPEASFGTFELMDRHWSVDYVVKGEGEETFRDLIAVITRTAGNSDALPSLSAEIPGLAIRIGEDIVSTPERIPIADLDTLPSPFALGLVDLAKPLVYLETSRGCPFSCAFCLSSREKGVRTFSLARVRDDLRLLIESGAQTVKLVDRTFNHDSRRAGEIWDFILRNNRESCFHFEIAADLLTEENFRILERVPAGMFRFEIGVQSGNEETLARVGRISDLERLSANVRRLVATTRVTVHLDLVAGLPHEDFDGFLDSLQTVFDLLDLNNPYFFACQGNKEDATGALTRPSATLSQREREKSTLPPGGRDRERAVRRGASDAANAGRREKTDCFVQVEPLKVLKGSPMRRIAREEGYCFSDTPPYKILQTPWLSFTEISRIEAISRLIDLFLNSGRFRTTLATLARTIPLARLFARMALLGENRLTDAARSLAALFDYFWDFGQTVVSGQERERLRDALCYDYCLTECPVSGREPRFFPEKSTTTGNGKREKPADLARRLGIGTGSRVRSYSLQFVRDPRRTEGAQEEVELVFVYASAPGRGLEVRVVEAGRD